MSDIKLVELAEAPAEGAGKQINMVHPLTEYPYQLGLFHIKDRYFVVTDHCKECGGTLAIGKLNGMYALCSMEDHPWNVKTGLLKYDRTQSLPTYRVQVRDDGIYIEI